MYKKAQPIYKLASAWSVAHFQPAYTSYTQEYL